MPVSEACTNCGATGVEIEKHHPDYREPFRVVSLCLSCHREADDARRACEKARIPSVIGDDGSPIIPLDKIADYKVLSAIWLL